MKLRKTDKCLDPLQGDIREFWTKSEAQSVKKDDISLKFKDLSFDEQELLHRYRTNIIFQAQVDRIIYERLGSDALDEAKRIDKTNRKRMNDKEV